LKLPPWLERNRATIEESLRPLVVPEWHPAEAK